MTYEQQIQDFREKYKSAVGTDRKILEQRARLLKWAIEKRDKVLEQTVANVKATLL